MEGSLNVIEINSVAPQTEDFLKLAVQRNSLNEFCRVLGRRRDRKEQIIGPIETLRKTSRKPSCHGLCDCVKVLDHFPTQS